MKRASKKDKRRLTILVLIFIPLLTLFISNMFSYWSKIYNNVKETKMKTIGKMLDEKLTVESIATICLGTFVEKELGKKKMNYYFITQNIGNATFKSPEDMFDELLIPNDLNYVAQKIKEYYPNKFKTN